jgi:hypothetical protein
MAEMIAMLNGLDRPKRRRRMASKPWSGRRSMGAAPGDESGFNTGLLIAFGVVVGIAYLLRPRQS